ncbi:MAG: CoA-binding protein, partial [Halobacteriota archaeon]|nr:CoA-binding protein [Halobacteriota archaeon]
MDSEKINEFEEIFNPKSVAVVGASSSMKFGSFFLNSLKGFGFEGALYPVNPKEDEIMGLKSYPTVKDIPGEVDFVGISVPAKYVPDVMRDCAEKGVKAVEIFSSGFNELDGNGIALEKEIVQIAREANFRIIGPNCFGIYCPKSKLTLLPGYDFSKESGPVAFIGQSGGYSADMCVRAKGWGINFSKLISYGNASDLNETDFIEYFGCDPETKIITAYIEGVRGDRFVEVIRDVTKDKPVIIWKGGLTNSGSRAVASHTGSLGGQEILWKAVFKQTGAIQASSLEEIIDTTLAFLHLQLDCGRNVTIL